MNNNNISSLTTIIQEKIQNSIACIHSLKNISPLNFNSKAKSLNELFSHNIYIITALSNQNTMLCREIEDIKKGLVKKTN